jgi:hypothetical protein
MNNSKSTNKPSTTAPQMQKKTKRVKEEQNTCKRPKQLEQQHRKLLTIS